MRPIVPFPSKPVKTRRDETESSNKVSSSRKSVSMSADEDKKKLFRDTNTPSVLSSSIQDENNSQYNVLTSPIHLSSDLREEDGEDDEDILNDSDSTPVHKRPPVHASHEEKLHFYWQLCYGQGYSSEPKPGDGIWSANRQPPNKSCFSSRKRGSPSPYAVVPSSTAHVTPNGVASVQGLHSTNSSAKQIPSLTCSTAPLDILVSGPFTPLHSAPVSVCDGTTKSVKFGFSSAVEFDDSKPSIDLTPLPSNVAHEYFPLDSSLESDDSSEAKHRETAYNISVLAEWDKDFDSFIEDEEEDSPDPAFTVSPMFPDTSRSTPTSRQRRSSDFRELRRNSEFFCRDGGPLLTEEKEVPARGPTKLKSIQSVSNLGSAVNNLLFDLARVRLDIVHSYRLLGYFNWSSTLEAHTSIAAYTDILAMSKLMEEISVADIDSKSVLADVLNECILILNQQLKAPIHLLSPSVRKTLELTHRSFSPEELSTIDSILLRIALQEWRKMELQALWETPLWLTPIIEENMKESHRASRAYLSLQYNVTNQASTNSQTSSLYKLGDIWNPMAVVRSPSRKPNRIRPKFYHELQQLDSLRNMIEIEKKAVDQLKREVEYWQQLCNIEFSMADRLLESLVLKNILPFEVSTLSANNIDIVFRHIDDSITTTRIMQQTGSSPGSLGIMNNPSVVIHRLKNVKVPGDTQRRQWIPNIPNKSVAYKLYCAILDHDLFVPFLRKCFNEDCSVTWLSIVSDIFDRLQLLMTDVSELGKYYRVKVADTPTNSGCIELHVIINLGSYITIGIRFTYDLSKSWTMYRMAPSQIYLSGITGEPAVPLTTLQRSLERTLSYEAPISNAFLLKRLCMLLVETIQRV